MEIFSSELVAKPLPGAFGNTWRQNREFFMSQTCPSKKTVDQSGTQKYVSSVILYGSYTFGDRSIT